MKHSGKMLAAGAALTLFIAPSRAWQKHSPGVSTAKVAHDYPIRPVPFTAVHLTDTFWAPRIETNRKVTIPFAFEKCEETGRVANFVHAAEALRGHIPDQDRKIPPYPFDDTDIYKVIEGASYTLSVKPDPHLESYIDGLIQKIGAAQEKDGYLYTARTIDPAHPHAWAGAHRWEDEEVLSHELYDLGHLYEAAVAYYQATGKRSLLDIALKSANLLCNTFGPGRKTIWPGHQIVEMGLVKLYRVTGDERYLNLAKFMLDSRGPGGSSYNQANLKVIDQTEAVGHAVRATYMYSGMADVAAMTGDTAYVHAIDTIWENVVGKKLYITGGIGATGAGEAFGANYELPNLTAYNETCASVGNDFWNQRLFLLHGDAKYIDVMERTLYNGLISGVSLDGRSFFYQNPLESNGRKGRSPWFGVACCPGNITRFMASVPGYVYALAGPTLYVNLFAGGNAEIPMGGRTLKIVQETRYPWDGKVKITVDPGKPGAFTIKVRIPGWARGEAVPSDLYRFADVLHEPARLRVNGREVPVRVTEGYATLRREWKSGDVIDLDLPMPVRRIVPNSQVAADRGRVALERGPIVYAAEGVDSPTHRVRNLLLPEDARLTAEFRPDLLNGVVVLEGKATSLAYDAHGKVTRTSEKFTAIPYYAWANRGRDEMIVWIPDSESVAKPAPWPTLATESKVTASQGGGRVTGEGMEKHPEAVNDGDEPSSSNDPASYFDWWPEKGKTEWIEYDFPKTATVSQIQVYWYDDTGRGEVRVPASWRVLYKDGGTWRPVAGAGPWGVDKDKYNTIAFAPVTTGALRLEVTMQPNWSAGVQKWKVK
ncbi:MAG TPA: beta-L-arabinofuranosidase domain-containing protein [Bryobacteraceae bacterium]|nr:beta-L-arabinofuranosidase domain-containing protein [Bryobacteraceae bacterium]